MKLKHTFFAKNKASGIKRLKKLQEQDKYYRKFKGVKLARKQIYHIAGWKTWRLY